MWTINYKVLVQIKKICTYLLSGWYNLRRWRGRARAKLLGPKPPDGTGARAHQSLVLAKSPQEVPGKEAGG